MPHVRDTKLSYLASKTLLRLQVYLYTPEIKKLPRIDLRSSESGLGEVYALRPEMFTVWMSFETIEFIRIIV